MGLCCSNSESYPLSPSDLKIPAYIESKSINIHSFNPLKLLGKGSFGKVMLMEKKDTKHLYAIKAIVKKKLSSSKKMRNAIVERKVLAQVASPFVVKLHYAFQSAEKLFLVLDFMQGGDLYYHLRQQKCFHEEAAKFYAAEIILALEDLHKNDILYRDLKPENVLLDKYGHIKLADFNLAKSFEGQQKSNTICGTPEYISPEILKGKNHGKEVDFWGFGCIIYELIEGKSPFYASNYNQLFSKIVNGSFQFSDKFSTKAMDLISQLLSVSVKNRLVSNEKIKSHEFFKGIDWEVAYNKKLDPPIKPEIKNESDIRYFPPLGVDTSPNPSQGAQLRDNQFEGFTYTDTNSITEGLLKVQDNPI